MRELHVLGLSADGRTLLLAATADAARPSHAVPVDDHLQRVLRGQGPQADGRDGPRLTPRDMQARLRAGASIEEVAVEAGVPASRVERYAGPVLSELAQVLTAAHAAVQVGRRGRSAQPLEAAVTASLAGLSTVRDPVWSSHRSPEHGWVARFTATVRGRAKQAEWAHEAGAPIVRPLDPWASQLGHAEAPAPVTSAAPKPRSATGEAARPVASVAAARSTARGRAKAAPRATVPSGRAPAAGVRSAGSPRSVASPRSAASSSPPASSKPASSKPAVRPTGTPRTTASAAGADQPGAVRPGGRPADAPGEPDRGGPAASPGAAAAGATFVPPGRFDAGVGAAEATRAGG